MLSAVESPYGPGRPYAHHFAGQTIPSSLLAPCPISALPLNTAAAVASMSAAKFVRPHPKTRYNRGSLRNGLTSPRSKYLEQTDPVNLAVSQSPTASLSLSDTNIVSSQSQNFSDSDALNSSISSIYGTHKLPFGSSQPGAPVDPYQSLNYSTLYGRTPTIYGAQPMYQPHPLATRGQLHHRPTYIPSQLDHYSTYLPSVSILPPAIPSTQISPSGSSLTQTKAAISNERSQSDTSSGQTHLSNNAVIVAAHDKNNDIKLHHNILSSNGSNGNLIVSNGKSIGFKVPSGKEGSLKHRILTRPYGEKDSTKTKSSIHGSIVRSSNNNNAPTNFTKGSLIELANGELRTVEDMRTEDFILSSSKNPDLQLADTTVVNIVNGHQNNVLITFNYNNSKIEMEALPEHPFFVYGHGWASCHPEGSLQVFGLKCNRLQIGDTCISLTPRVDPPAVTPTVTVTQQMYYNPYNYSTSNCKDETMQIPQNLSRKQQTISTTATTTAALNTAVSSRTASHTHPSLAYAAFMNCSPINHCMQNVSAMSNDIGHQSSTPPTPAPATKITSRPLSQDGLTRTIPLHIIASSNAKSTGSPPIMNRPPSNHTAAGMFPLCSNNDDMVVDATLSKKRRWSAPDNICDDESCQKSGQKTCNH